MMWRNKRIHKLYAFALAAVFALTLAGCGGGGGGTAEEPPPMPTAQETCENAGGRYNADGSCTSAADLAAEAAAEAAALQAAKDAAAAALAAARAAVDAVADQASANVSAYADARDAVEDAAAANAAAQAAGTSGDAEKYQAAAEAAQAAAEAAAMLVSDAHAAAEAARIAAEEEAARLAAEQAERERLAAEAEAQALADAKAGAGAAAMAAMAALDAAKASLAGIADISGSDPDSYAAAMAALEKAQVASDAANAANQAAGLATTSEQAKLQQGIAEAEQAKAEMAQADAMKYAGMVMAAKAEADRLAAEEAAEMAAAEEAAKLAAAQTAASNALAAAVMARVEAIAAFNALSSTDNVTTAALQAAAASLATATAEAEKAAQAAANAAISTTSASAEGYQAMAEAARDAAQAALGMITTAKADLDESNRLAQEEADRLKAEREAAERAETERVEARDNARTAAMQSYMDADADATKAEAAADAAEATAAGTPGAMEAREAAVAARAAANAAKTAHDGIGDDSSKEDSEAAAAAAAEAAGNANSAYMMAKAANDAIQTAANIGNQQEEARKLAAAKTSAQNLYDDEADGVTFHYEAVMAKAADARTQANNARASANQAKAARTDYENADKYATMAEAAADEAEAALARARTAKANADAALQASKDATLSTAAEEALANLRTANAALTEEHTGDTGAGMDYMTAKDNAMKAADAAGVRVLRLFQAANGAHVPDLDSTMNIDETAVHVASVGTAMATIAAAASGAQAAGTTATAAWPGDTVDDPTTAGTDESSEGMLSITVSPAGAGDMPFELGATREADNTVTPAITARIQTARKIDDLGAFAGYEIWEDDGDATTNTDRARVIVFTDKTQDKSPVAASDAVTARSVLDAAIATPGELSNVRSSGRTITGVTWTPAGEGAMTGTLSCPANTACSIELGTDGAVTAISGYTFTGSRAAKAAVTACDAACQATANSDYLAFGLWLDEGTDGTDTFGSFASGGQSANVQAIVTGTATYTGKAAGAHHKTGEGVNWFHGDATLTANFGAIDDAAERGTDPPADTSPGTISGEISNIRVNGGAPLSDSIVLRQAALTDATATFNGNARMGAGEIQADDTVEYPFNGTWSGSFFGTTADDTETANVNESQVAPKAVAGTFGVTKTTGTGDDAVVESFVGAFGARR